ncbi:MAG: SCO family protein [Nocardioidaceae bacterium]|nr:SCO family protein [Nocardioidaceae bacterium]
MAACADDPVEPDNPGGALISNEQQDTTFRGAEPLKPYDMPDIALTATNEAPFNLINDTPYPVTLFFFGYTHCPDVCLLVMSDLTAALLQLPGDVREQTQLVYVTTDPARDTPEVLRTYLDRYSEDIVGLTGSLDDISVAAEAMGVAIEGRRRLSSGGYEVGHGAQVIGFLGDRAPVIWTQGTPVSDLVADITQLARS